MFSRSKTKDENAGPHEGTDSARDNALHLCSAGKCLVGMLKTEKKILRRKKKCSRKYFSLRLRATENVLTVSRWVKIVPASS